MYNLHNGKHPRVVSSRVAGLGARFPVASFPSLRSGLRGTPFGRGTYRKFRRKEHSIGCKSGDIMIKKQWCYCAIGLVASAYIFVYFSTVSTLDVIVWPDSASYVALQAVPMSSGSLFLKKMLYGQRPFVVPLLFKVLGNAHRIVAAQILLYVFSWIALGVTFAVTINRRWLKILSFVSILMFSMSTNLFFWPKAILSESLYISFFILSLSSFLWVGIFMDRRLTRSARVILLGETCFFLVLFSWTRDICMAILLCFQLPFLAIAAYTNLSKDVKRSILYSFLAIFIVVIFLAQYTLLHRAGRYRVNLVNAISFKILPYPDRKEWFITHGMPDNDEVLRLTGKGAWACNYDLSAFGDFIGARGCAVYAKFLLTHPYFTIKSVIDNEYEIVNGSLSEYSRSSKINQIQERVDKIIWLRGRWIYILYGAAVILNIAALVNSGAAINTDNFWISFILLLSALPLSAICYHTDIWEVTRHCLSVQLNARLGIIFTILFFLDNPFSYMSRK
jgi:hypothetical protein